jgi:3-oxoacyl-[acyl-carrier protein] reductase
VTKKLADKVALITGGSRGIGAAIARRLARDGAAVAITYASAQQKADEVVRAIESAGGRAVPIRADSGDAGAVKNAVAETARTLGRLDVLVNNAGIAVIAPLDRFSLNDFEHGGGECPRRLRCRAGGVPPHERRRAHHHHRQRQRRPHSLPAVCTQ